MIKKAYVSFLKKENDKIVKMKSRKTNMTMNLMKAYLILSVVTSHTQGGGIIYPMSNWIMPTFYFMPAFIFVSGYFYKEEMDGYLIGPFVTGKVKTLVVPYFIWNIVYGLLNTLFRKYEIIRYGNPVSWGTLFVEPWITGHQFHFNIASWFLLALFLVVIVMFMIRKLLNKWKRGKDIILLIAMFLLSVISIKMSQRGFNVSWGLCILRVGFLLPFYQMGFCYKKHEEFFRKYRSYFLVLCFIMIYIVDLINGDKALWPIVVFCNFKGDAVLLLLMSVAGTFITVLMCDFLVPAFENNKMIQYIGDHTFTIMMHHGIIIFLINIFLFMTTYCFSVSGFDVEKFKSTLWYVYAWRDEKIYIIYVLAAVCVPLIIKKFSEMMLEKLAKKIK